MRYRFIRDRIVIAYLFFTTFFLLLITVTPFVYKCNVSIGSRLYYLFSFVCHQIPERSMCIYPDTLHIRDCIDTNEPTELVSREDVVFVSNHEVGYKFPVCSRCLAFYTGMFIGGFLYLIKNSKHPVRDGHVPPIWIFLLVITPFAVDGTLQFLGLWESTNFIRIVTGFPPGLIIPFYFVPLLKNLSNRRLRRKEQERKEPKRRERLKERRFKEG